MKVKELIEYLKTFDQELEVVYQYASDFDFLEPQEVEVIELVNQPSAGYVMRSHPTMSEDNKSRAKKYLAFPGN